MTKKIIKLSPNGGMPIEFYSWGTDDTIGLIPSTEQSNEQIQDAFDSIELYEDSATSENDYIFKVLGKEVGRIVIPTGTFVKDGYYDSDSKEIVIVLNVGEEDEKEIRVDVKDLIDIYVGDDITIDVKDNKISLSDTYKNSIQTSSEKISELGGELKDLKNEIPDFEDYATIEWVNDKGFLTEHQDISGKANVGDSYTKEESDAKYLTEHQDLSDYAKAEDIEEYYALKSEIPSLDGYAKSTEIPTKTSDLTNDSGFLTEHQDLSDYAKVEDIPSLDGYATEEWVNEQGFLTEHQDISGKANVGDSYTKEESDAKYLTEHQSLDEYAKTADVEAAYQEKGDYALKSEIPSIANLATKAELELKADKEHTHDIEDVDSLQDQLDSKLDEKAVKAILKEEIHKLFNLDSIDASDFNSSNTTDPNLSYVVLGNGETVTMDSPKQFTGKSVKLSNIDLESNATTKSSLLIKSDKVEIDDVTLSGQWSKSVSGNAMMSINDATQVEVNGVGINRTGGYNVVEIGLNSTEHCNYVVVDGLEITEKISNNGINIFSMNDNANIIIKNCHFTEVSNPIRISNATNAKNVNITIKDCTFDKWDTDPNWAGLIIFQDYTTKTREEIIENKPFASFKVTIDNVTGPYGKLSNEYTMEEICGSTDIEKRLIYMFANHYSESNGDALIPYSEDMYPTVTIL